MNLKLRQLLEYLAETLTVERETRQPQLNDLDAIHRSAARRRIPMIRVSVNEEELTSGSVLRRFRTGVSLSHAANSFDDARRIMSTYLRAAQKTCIAEDVA